MDHARKGPARGRLSGAWSSTLESAAQQLTVSRIPQQNATADCKFYAELGVRPPGGPAVLPIQDELIARAAGVCATVAPCDVHTDPDGVACLPGPRARRCWRWPDGACSPGTCSPRPWPDRPSSGTTRLIYIHIASRSLWSKAFWAGPRPPATPLLIDLVGSSSGFLAAQALIAAALVGIPGLDGRPPGRPGMAAGGGRLGDPRLRHRFPVTLWNRSVLSESLSMSLLALLFATLIWAARRLTWPRVAAATAVCLCFAATRDAQVWTVGLLALAVGAGALLAAGRDRGLAIRAGTLALCLAAVVVLTGWGTVSSHRTKQNVADVFYVRIFPFPDRVAWFAAHGMPDQQQIDRLAKATTTDARGAPRRSSSRPRTPPLRRWSIGSIPRGPTPTASGFSPIPGTCSPSRCSGRSGPSTSPTGASRSMQSSTIGSSRR